MDQTLKATGSCHDIFRFSTREVPSPTFLHIDSFKSLCWSSFMFWINPLVGSSKFTGSEFAWGSSSPICKMRCQKQSVKMYYREVYNIYNPLLHFIQYSFLFKPSPKKNDAFLYFKTRFKFKLGISCSDTYWDFIQINDWSSTRQYNIFPAMTSFLIQIKDGHSAPRNKTIPSKWPVILIQIKRWSCLLE